MSVEINTRPPRLNQLPSLDAIAEEIAKHVYESPYGGVAGQREAAKAVRDLIEWSLS